MSKKLLWLIFTWVIFAQNSYARFQTLDDADLTYDFYNVDTQINADGTSEAVVEIQITILREDARSLASKFPINYNSDSTAISIIEAKTIFNNTEYAVTNDMIEDKSIGSNMPGFDDQKQIAISFPYPEVGAKIYLKYKQQVTKTSIENEFCENYYFGIGGGYWKQSNITINSAIDLQIKTNDPYGNLLVNTEDIKDKPKYFRKAQIKLLKPMTSETTNELSSSNLSPNLLTYFSVSSIDKWEKFGNSLAPRYVEIQNQPMPELFADIYKEALVKKDILSQINTITAKLNEKVQYFGAWQSHKGKFIPQDLALVASKQTGDCKDFATITVKILKELGYKANVALVERSVGNQEMENVLPNSSAFNHAIVKVLDKNDKIYWIDPTNLVSMAEGLFPDIAGKHALVLDKDKSSYENIPNISETHAKRSVNQIIMPDKTVNLTLNLMGEEAINLSGAGLYLSKRGIEDLIYNVFVPGDIEESNRINSTIPALTQRIVNDLSISLEYKNPNIFLMSNLGSGYSLNPNLFLVCWDLIKIDGKNYVNDFYLGNPRTWERKRIIKQTKAQNLKDLNFSLSTPYITLLRECGSKGEDMIILEKIIIHTSWIKNNEFESDDFKKLQQFIRDKVINRVVIMGPI